METYADITVRWVVAALFALAAWSKLNDPDSVRYQMIEGGIAPRHAGVMTVALPAIELVTVFGLIAFNSMVVVVWTQLLLISFTLYLANLVIRDVTSSCGCFGDVLDLSPRQAIFRNLILVGVLMISYNAVGWNWNPLVAEVSLPLATVGAALCGAVLLASGRIRRATSELGGETS